MEYKTNIHGGALMGIANGIQICCDAVKGTLGAKGENVIVEKDLYPFSIVTNDGASIIESIVLEDPLEKRGHAFVKEAIDRSNSNAGDGSTTTVILLNAIIQEAIRQGVRGLEVKKSLDEALPIIEQEIDKQTKQIGIDEVENVARISGENDELAKTLKDIFSVIGADGIINLENSGTYETTYSLSSGVKFDCGFMSPFMAYDEEAQKNNQKENRAIYKNPTILVTKRKINSVNDIDPLIRTLQKQEKNNIVIFTDDIDSNVLSFMVKAHQGKVFNICVIKAPILWKGYIFEDFAKCVGATIVDDSTGLTFKNLPIEALGTCEKIVVDRNETTLVGIQDISDHIKELEAQGDNDSKLRLSWLNTKTATLKLGAKSETELSYLRLKAEDAINASKWALKEGVVAGGGVCLRDIASIIKNPILSKAITEPFNQNCFNMGLDNVVTAGITFGDDIVDSSRVVKNAVRNAIGIASTILTSNIVITIPPKTKEQIEQEMMAKMRPF